MVRRVFGFIVIRGHGRSAPNYEASVESKLAQIAASGAGGQLIGALRRTGRMVRIQPTPAEASDHRLARLDTLFTPEAHSSVRYTPGALPEMYGEVNVGGRTLFEPEYRRREVAGADGLASWREEDPAAIFDAQWTDSTIELFHLLTHQLRFYMGLRSRIGRKTAANASDADARAELAGILFENVYRAELGEPLRMSDGRIALGQMNADFGAAWRDPLTRPHLETILTEMPEFVDRLRELPIRPHPLWPDGRSDF